MATKAPPPYSKPAATLLKGPAPKITISPIDFKKTVLPEYDGMYAVVLDNVLTAEECGALVAAAETSAGTGKGWERALVNVGNYQQKFIPDARNCDRIIWDDADVVQRLWDRIRDYIPEVLRLDPTRAHITGNGPAKRSETFVATRLNERMRFLRYGPGEYFREHCDGVYVTPDGSERSYCTIHLYLNESTEENPLIGGATSFHSLGWKTQETLNVDPKIGRVLVFQHKKLVHSGQEVDRGLKLTMRTDIMYKLEEDGGKEK